MVQQSKKWLELKLRIILKKNENVFMVEDMNSLTTDSICDSKISEEMTPALTYSVE
jgi:hypothetical protein